MPIAEAAGTRLAGAAVIAAVHAAAVWGLWQHPLRAPPREATTVFVSLIAPPPAMERSDPPRRPPARPSVAKPRPAAAVAHRPAVADPPAVAVASVTAADTASPPPAEPPAVPRAPAPPATPAPPMPAPPPAPAEPIALAGELALTCTERAPPRYPPLSRRLGEEGVVALRVELDRHGGVSAARVWASSGHRRLDEAALAAVRAWRCTPAQRDGTPVHAVALQPFKFVLQAN